MHVDVLDQLVGGVGLEEPVQVQRAGRVATGLVRESGLNGDVRAQAVWRTGREYPADAFDGLGQAVAVTEDGDEASQVLGGVARAVARDEPLDWSPGTRANSGSIRATETTAGPVIRRSIRRVPVRARGRGGRHPSGGHPAGRGGLRSPSNAEYHAAMPAARPGCPGSSWSPLAATSAGGGVGDPAGFLRGGCLGRSGRAFGRCWRDRAPSHPVPLCAGPFGYGALRCYARSSGPSVDRVLEQHRR